MQTKSTSLTGKALVLSLDRAGFIKYCLSLHTLEDNFELQRPNGPAFTIYWTGSAGGKSNRLTIKDDDQYKNVQDELKKCNPNQKNFRVIVEFDLDSMISWETHKRCATDYPSTNDNFTELNSGTKRLQIPRLDGFSEEERLVGHFVNEINKKYPCTEHKGEHGNNGTCWKDADNQHVGLNNRMKKLWAEAIVSGNATIKEPPNIPGIESTRDGVPVVRPRGRGPKASLQANAQPSENHTPALLLASVAATLAASLSDLSYTPDLIPELSVEKLAELMNCVEGVALRFCKFCIHIRYNSSKPTIIDPSNSQFWCNCFSCTMNKPWPKSQHFEGQDMVLEWVPVGLMFSKKTEEHVSIDTTSEELHCNYTLMCTTRITPSS
ncbi:hypothetical protein EV368DRAFT_68090 [Lentinula lateritia]|nr:hypothetical protein EV368DRAFT_68090 [Lentinula lateritia]